VTGSITWLVIAVLAFVGSHVLLASAPIRRPLVATLGERGFAGMFSLVAGITLAWLVFAFGAAPRTILWDAPWAYRLPFIVMPFVLVLLVCGFSQRNPTAVMQPTRYAGDPAPGILKVTRHPVMWAFGLWALAHIPPNGDDASLILFGSLALLALAGTAAIDAKARARDPEAFARLAAATSNVPLVAVMQGRARFALADIGWARIAVALALYAALIFAHPFVAGVALR
jgi:uncharacterized membrane protein